MSKKFCTFAVRRLRTAMTIDLYINKANDYAQDIGAPVYHPHVSVIHYDEVGEIRHTLNRINCYGIFLQKDFPEGLTYGIGTYHEGDGSLMAYSPGRLAASWMTAHFGGTTAGYYYSTMSISKGH